MKLVIGNQEYGIKQFHFSINFNEENNKEDIEVFYDGEDDIATLAQSLRSVYEDSLRINTDKKSYEFTGFELQSVRNTVSGDGEVIVVRFGKE